jgi:two-component sensor histidine kinase
MPPARPIRWWLAVGAGLLAALALAVVYAWLPADGATGDLESLQPGGFAVKWLLQARPDGLRAGDVIVRAEGTTVDEWLAGAPRGPEWHTGGVVAYNILRPATSPSGGNMRPLTLLIRLAPVPLSSILARWWLQLAAGAAVFTVGLIVLYRRPGEPAARALTLACITLGLQYWGDAWNLQFTTLVWRWPLVLQATYEFGMFSLTVSSMLLFALLFPVEHPLARRHPRRVAAVVYGIPPALVALVAAGGAILTRSWSAGRRAANTASWAVGVLEIGLALAAGVRSAVQARDPVARAQVRWIVWWGVVGLAILIPGYVLPQILGRQPLVPHPAAMIIVSLIPWTLATAILRYHLFDIQVIINRTLVYGTLSVLLAGLYLVLVRFFSLIVPLVVRRQNDLAVVFVATLGVALAFAPLRRRIQMGIDRAFYRGRPDYPRLLPEMSARLATSIELDQVAAILTDELPRRLQIRWARLIVIDPAGEHLVAAGPAAFPPAATGGAAQTEGGPSVVEEERFSLPVDHPLVADARRLAQPIVRLQPPPGLAAQTPALLEQAGVELCLPLLTGTELAGLYLVGPQQSDDAYPGDEVRLLHLLGQQAAIAVQNSHLFQAEREQRRRAEALLGEKEILLEEIHHRVKNNLQVISSLLYLQSRQIQDPATLDMFLESQRRVRSMALIHETLCQMGDVAHVNGDEYVRELAHFLSGSYGIGDRVRVRVEATNVLLGLDIAVPCGLIINELVSNALKHAFPDGRKGEVRIAMAAGPAGCVTLTVADNGAGLPPDLDWQTARSLGMHLVRRLVQQIGGQMHVRSGGAGTTFTVTFGGT